MQKFFRVIKPELSSGRTEAAKFLDEIGETSAAKKLIFDLIQKDPGNKSLRYTYATIGFNKDAVGQEEPKLNVNIPTNGTNS